jgi:hypothetical protein
MDGGVFNVGAGRALTMRFRDVGQFLGYVIQS